MWQLINVTLRHQDKIIGLQPGSASSKVRGTAETYGGAYNPPSPPSYALTTPIITSLHTDGLRRTG